MAIPQREVGAIAMPAERFRIVGEVVSGKEREQHQVRPIFQPPLSERQIFLRRAVAVYRKADDLDPPPFEGRTTRQDRFELLPI